MRWSKSWLSSPCQAALAFSLKGPFPSMKRCGRMALGYWQVSSCHLSLCSPCKVEKGLGMKIWGPCLLGHPYGGNGKVSHPHPLCSAGLCPSLGPCMPDYMKETLACLTWHTGKSRNSHKKCQISSNSICSHLTNHNCVGKTERLCLSCSWSITLHQIMQPDSVIKRTQ